jgi:hypothetical protein
MQTIVDVAWLLGTLCCGVAPEFAATFNHKAYVKLIILICIAGFIHYFQFQL